MGNAEVEGMVEFIMCLIMLRGRIRVWRKGRIEEIKRGKKVQI